MTLTLAAVFVELEFIRYPPSLLASGCICTALVNLLPYSSDSHLHSLHSILGIDLVSLNIIVLCRHHCYVSSLYISLSTTLSIYNSLVCATQT